MHNKKSNPVFAAKLVDEMRCVPREVSLLKNLICLGIGLPLKLASDEFLSAE